MMIPYFASVIGVVQLVLVMIHMVTGQSYIISNLTNTNDDCKKITFNEITQGIPNELINQMACSIEVRNQQLDTMTVKGFCNWKNLIYLYAEMGNIKLIANLFADCHKLQILSLSGNKIVTIDKNTFQNLSALTTLDLSNNNIDIFNGSVCKPLQSLAYLRLNNNKLTKINANAFQYLSNLVKLDLSHNFIRKIDDDTFMPLQVLKTLNVSYNPDLSYMKYMEIPKLKVLNIEHDQFTELYVTANLSKIIANFNKIATIFIEPTNKLERIYLRNNSLLHIDWITKTQNLSVLDVANNNISFDFHSMFVFFTRKNLIYDLSGNPINSKLDTLGIHDSLVADYLSHKVARLEHDINNLTEKLYGSEPIEIEHDIKSLSNLTENVSDLKYMTYWTIIVFTLFVVFQIGLYAYKSRMHANFSFSNVFGRSNRPTNGSDEFNEFYPNLLEQGF